jgi:hypothetical protein
LFPSSSYYLLIFLLFFYFIRPTHSLSQSLSFSPLLRSARPISPSQKFPLLLFLLHPAPSSLIWEEEKENEKRRRRREAEKEKTLPYPHEIGQETDLLGQEAPNTNHKSHPSSLLVDFCSVGFFWFWFFLILVLVFFFFVVWVVILPVVFRFCFGLLKGL